MDPNQVLAPRLCEAMGAEPYLTRLRAVMTPTAMDGDVVLVPVSGWGDVESGTYLSAAPAPALTARLAVALLPLGLLAAAGLMRRRGWPRRAAAISAALACLALTML